MVRRKSLFDPVVNIRVGTDILEEYLESADGDLSQALAKYSGNARGYAKTVIDESRKLAQIADTATAEDGLSKSEPNNIDNDALPRNARYVTPQC